MKRQISLSLAALGLAMTAASAAPAKLIIMRHGEKATSWKLCATGKARAAALVGRYLGKGADASLFGQGQSPVAFIAITPHTLELVAPAAESWGLPVTMYPALPGDDGKEGELHQRTQQAANAVLNDAAYVGKTVVMSWEHHHIADAKLQAAAGEPITLRELFGLGAFDAPKTWPGSNYDYFWIVTFGADGKAASFTARQQLFPGNDSVPQNAWEEKQILPADCVH